MKNHKQNKWKKKNNQNNKKLHDYIILLLEFFHFKLKMGSHQELIDGLGINNKFIINCLNVIITN